MITYTVPPAPGDTFAVPGRRVLLPVAQLFASFTHHDPAEAQFLVQTPAGARWIVMRSLKDDGPPWEGRAVPAETTTL